MVKKNSNPKISAATQKVRPKRTSDLQNQQEEEEEEERNEEEVERDEEEEEKKSRHGKGLFHACYLLTSLCPRFKGHTYIGYTVNPRRRIRQHNGEIRCGAFRTKKRRPWEMVLCLYGFPSNVSALQFEWAWQHPTESLAVRQAAATFKSFSGVANKIKLAYTMLNLPAWQSLNITVNYFSTKYTTHSAGCPRLPEHMNVHVRSMEELPCYTETDENSFEGRDAEIGWYGEDEHRETGDAGKAVNANLMELQAIPVNLSARTASAILSSFSTRDTQEKNMITLIEGSDYELDWSGGENRRSNTADPDEVQPSIRSPAVPRRIEVIDLVSPSTECRIMRTNKKRRISVVCPVIDLT